MSSHDFSEGDWIVHAFYGVGQVQGRVKKIIEGSEVDYLWIKTENSDYWLPIENIEVEYIRRLASEIQIKQALAILKKEPNPLHIDHYKRRKEILEALKNVSLEIKAGLIRDLSGRKLKKGLNVTEEDAFVKLKSNFILEWALVTGEEKNILEAKLSKALHSSPPKKATNKF